MRTGFIIMAIEQTLNRKSADDRLLNDLTAVIHLYMYILIIIRFNSHKRSKFAESLASGLNDAHMWNILLHFYCNTLDTFTES